MASNAALVSDSIGTVIVMSPATTDVPSPIGDRSKMRAAYERRLGEILAVPKSEFVRMNLDVRSAVATVLGVLPKVAPLRQSMSGLLGLNQSLIDGLEDYALATAEASSLYVIATSPPEDIIALNEQAMKLRETLKIDATALAHRGLIERERLLNFKGLTGFKNVGFELVDWATLLGDCWPRIAGKTALTAAEVQEAKLVGERLVRLAGRREQAPPVVAEVARIRRQAMTLLVNAYDEVRRAVRYLRRKKKDADAIAPSLYADGRGRKARPEQPPAPAPNPTPPTPDPVVPEATPDNPVPVGLPGASPFIATLH